ncbi:GNAT family N-acetyltransferase [Pseudomonas sp. BBP2017]|uniref:GNAT family N-acetyltransferase n=1 Tax=Pseudomonas sp. BBP2017 TaxID=2109731 RepID=UPI000D1391FD|nr:GNAT family N-acetyltransferase [Pseudomonas sp. BBP2017]PSS58713.1 GNAT family N-acetyltransferase [Pseudomonas sp. BBP2017]
MSNDLDNRDLCKEHWIESLSDGTAVLIRPLSESDHERDHQFVGQVPYESRRFRFLAGFSGKTSSLFEQLADVDYHRRMAYVALVHDGGQLRQIGESRYAAVPGSKNCECAVAVNAHWQRKGLGRLLMNHLITAARSNGYACMTSRDLSSNYGMHRLAKALGFSSRYLAGDVSEIIHELDLQR